MENIIAPGNIDTAHKHNVARIRRKRTLTIGVHSHKVQTKTKTKSMVLDIRRVATLRRKGASHPRGSHECWLYFLSCPGR